MKGAVSLLLLLVSLTPVVVSRAQDQPKAEAVKPAEPPKAVEAPKTEPLKPVQKPDATFKKHYEHYKKMQAAIIKRQDEINAAVQSVDYLGETAWLTQHIPAGYDFDQQNVLFVPVQKAAK